MFLRACNLIMSLARAEAIPAPQVPAAGQEAARAEAFLAMSRDPGNMSLSQRLSDPAAYLRVQRGRRQALEAMLPVPCDGEALRRVTDLICMIAEESAWSENPKGAPFDDDQHPEIDFQCAETLALLAWTQRVLGERLGAQVFWNLTLWPLALWVFRASRERMVSYGG